MFGNSDQDENNIAAEAAAKARKNYQTLRDANAVRQHEWDPGNHARDLFWRANELAGETGELCNVLKKIHRERCGVAGSRAVLNDLAEEAADVLICIDLLALDYGVSDTDIQSFADHVMGQHGHLDGTLVERGTMITRCLGRVCDVLYEDDGPDGHHDEMAARLGALQANILILARTEGINMLVAVANKFNATTHKMGLTTFLRYSEH